MNKCTYTIKATHNTGRAIHQEEIMRLDYEQAFQFVAKLQPKYRQIQMINETTGEIEFESMMSYAMWQHIYKRGQ